MAPDVEEPECPVAPPTEDPALLGFRRQGMVRWLTPAELVRAGVKALLSSLFGAYADNREIQALRPGGLAAYRYDKDRDELWMDYVADLGDGWDATYAVARLLASPALAFGSDGRGASDGPALLDTRRGDLLVMGGDQVYPTATREEYTNRLVGPYRAALPCVPTARRTPAEGLARADGLPHLFAIPGNHDWYDGLTSFTRLFCQQRWIGGWRTAQTRSYFALALPHGWWLWGIDVQLGSDIDEPQLQFFRKVAADAMPRGSRVILCVAEPTWVYTSQEGPGCYRNLAFFEEETLRKYGHEFAVGLSGDLHTYARYEDASGRQRFVAGGGGAYLFPTHRMPAELAIPSQPPGDAGDAGEPAFERFRLGHASTGAGPALFPDRAASRRYTFRSLALPFYNRAFAALIGAAYLVLVWLVQSASKGRGASFLESLVALGEGVAPKPVPFDLAFAHLLDLVAHAPAALLGFLVLAAGLVGMADGAGWRRLALGMAHALAHVALLLALTWLIASLTLGVWGWEEDAWQQVLVFAGLMQMGGALLGGVLVGLYFLVANVLFGFHTNEVLLCQSVPDYKHFLRLHIGPDGGLTIYPIGLRRVPRRWVYRPGASGGEAWYEPEGEPLADRAELIEPPIHLPARVPAPAAAAEVNA